MKTCCCSIWFHLFQSQEIPGIKIFRFECSLVYANVEHFVKKLYKKTVNPRYLKQRKAKAKAKAGKQPSSETMEIEVSNKANGRQVQYLLQLGTVIFWWHHATLFSIFLSGHRYGCHWIQSISCRWPWNSQGCYSWLLNNGRLWLPRCYWTYQGQLSVYCASVAFAQKFISVSMSWFCCF